MYVCARQCVCADAPKARDRITTGTNWPLVRGFSRRGPSVYVLLMATRVLYLVFSKTQAAELAPQVAEGGLDAFSQLRFALLQSSRCIMWILQMPRTCTSNAGSIEQCKPTDSAHLAKGTKTWLADRRQLKIKLLLAWLAFTAKQCYMYSVLLARIR